MLIDTNIWLELLLQQERQDEVMLFLEKMKYSELYVTEFSLYSVCVCLSKYKKYSVLMNFVTDTLISGNVFLLRVEPNEIGYVIDIGNKYKLDFDDSYQYYVSQRENLAIISFDDDFDGTPRGRKTPTDILKQ